MHLSVGKCAARESYLSSSTMNHASAQLKSVPGSQSVLSLLQLTSI